MENVSTLIAEAMGSEGIERAVHEKLAKAFHDSLKSGADQTGILAALRKALHDNELLHKIQSVLGDKVPGLTFTMIAAGVGEWLKLQDLDALFPDATGPIAKLVKAAIKVAGPALFVGIAEAAGDATEHDDEHGEHAGHGEDGHGTHGPTAKSGSIMVYMSLTPENDGRIAELWLDGAGEILRGKDGVPMITEKVLRAEKLNWDREHCEREGKRKVPVGKPAEGQKQQMKDETYVIPAIPFSQFDILELDFAIACMSDEMKGVNFDLIKKLSASPAKVVVEKHEKKKEKTWDEQVPRFTDFLISYIKSMRSIPASEREINLDFVQDLAGKAEPARMNALLDEMLEKRNKKTKLWSPEDVKVIADFARTALGADLRVTNQIRSAVEEFKANWKKTDSKWHHVVRDFLLAGGMLLLIALFGGWAIWHYGVWPFLHDGLWMAAIGDPKKVLPTWGTPAIQSLWVGGTVILAVTLFLPMIESALTVIRFLWKKSDHINKGWLAQKCHIITGAVAYNMVITTIIVMAGVPTPYRGELMLIPVLTSIFASAWLLMNGETEKVKKINIRTTQIVGFIVFAMVFILIGCWIIGMRKDDPSTLYMENVPKQVFVHYLEQITSYHVMTVLSLVLAALAGYFVTIGFNKLPHKPEEKKTVYLVTLVVVMLIAALLPWFSSIQESSAKYDAEVAAEEAKAENAEKEARKAEGQNVVTQESAPVRRTSSLGNRSVQPSEKGSDPDFCKKLPLGYRPKSCQ